MSNINPTNLYRLLHYRGENLCIYKKKPPTVRLGEEKPYKLPQQDKKTPICYIRLQRQPYGPTATSCLLRCFKLLRYLYFPLQLILSQGLLCPSQALLINCYILLLLFPILLTVPYMLSLINYYYIRYTSPPLQAY